METTNTPTTTTATLNNAERLFEFELQLILTVVSFVVITACIIFVMLRRNVFPIVRFSRLTLYGVSFVNWLFVVVCFIQSFTDISCRLYWLMYIIHDIFGVVILSEAFRIWILQGATGVRMQQLRHTGDPSDSYETLSDDRATLSTSSADPKSNEESTNVDDDEGSTPQRFERRRLSTVASEHATTAARRASATEAKKHQSLFIRLQPFASEQNRFIACVILAPVLWAIQLGATWGASSDPPCSPVFITVLMVFTNLFFMMIAGFFIIQFWRQRRFRDGLGIRMDLIKLVIVWLVAMIVWGIPQIMRATDDEFQNWRYLNAQNVFSVTMAVSYCVTNGWSAYKSLQKLRVDEKAATDRSSAVKQMEKRLKQKNHEMILSDSELPSDTLDVGEEDEVATRELSHLREQTKTYGATRSGLVASLTKYRDEFELFLAGEYALENVLFLDAVDAFYNMCGKSQLKELEKRHAAFQSVESNSTSGKTSRSQSRGRKKKRSFHSKHKGSKHSKSSAERTVSPRGERGLPPVVLQLLAERLYREFIESGSVNQVNVSYRAVCAIEQEFERMTAARPPKVCRAALDLAFSIAEAPSFFAAVHRLKRRKNKREIAKLAQMHDKVLVSPDIFLEATLSILTVLELDVLPRFHASNLFEKAQSRENV
eukprot:CAMPEP_0168600102 /NCGR_PEP_ID=MMETSP0420-20121227/12546_1 /TAXON_ID=498008 /ORGANISM="Pessonella sp." /LENGTH=655 /DNA_ID=CAMNT_0008638053 /DNA_START=27 /DNA_END=1994 /DNA_ORIENTATION=-